MRQVVREERMAKLIKDGYVHGVSVNDSGCQPGRDRAIETGIGQAGVQVQIESYENEYRLSIPAARFTAFGATRRDVRRNMVDLASATMEMCVAVGPNRLGPGPARRDKTLQLLVGTRSRALHTPRLDGSVTAVESDGAMID